MKKKKRLSIAHNFPFFFLLLLLIGFFALGSSHDYQDAVSKAILFFEGQRSGFFPQDQKTNWRANSGLSDGWNYNKDLTGGYYDAGDNVKFGFPMAFTTTMLSWSVIEFGDMMPPNELRNAFVAIRWSTDYLLKTLSQPNRNFVQVSDPASDHNCWDRPEDMDTARTAYAVDAPNPASDVAGETAAALATSSIAFRVFSRVFRRVFRQDYDSLISIHHHVLNLTLLDLLSSAAILYPLHFDIHRSPPLLPPYRLIRRPLWVLSSVLRIRLT